MDRINPVLRKLIARRDNARLLAALDSGDTATTNSWDTVFAIKLADVNAAIAKAGTSPKIFAVGPEDGYAIQGSFGVWQLSAGGGTGVLVNLTIPYQNATLTKPDRSIVPVSGVIVASVHLDFLHNADKPGTSGTVHELRVRTRTTDTSEVVDIDLDNSTIHSSGTLTLVDHGAILSLFDNWLNENLKDFDHVFATVNLNRTASQDGFQWMQPTDMAYAYADTANGDGILGVLCMTENRPATGLVQELSPVVIPDQQSAGFLISEQRLLSRLILPAMPQAFAGTSIGDFRISDSGDAIVKTNDQAQFNFTDTNNTSDPHG